MLVRAGIFPYFVSTRLYWKPHFGTLVCLLNLCAGETATGPRSFVLLYRSSNFWDFEDNLEYFNFRIERLSTYSKFFEHLTVTVSNHFSRILYTVCFIVITRFCSSSCVSHPFGLLLFLVPVRLGLIDEDWF
jgi:hypothetical protein